MPLNKNTPQYKADVEAFSRRLLSVIPTHMDSKQAATVCRINPSTFSRYICGRQIPTVPVLLRLCEGLKTTPNYLLGFKD